MLSALCALGAALADTLSHCQRSIVAIAASAATGALEHLRTALARGLDGGMTVNETKEVMVHAYAYCGFPAACVVCSPPHAGARRAQSVGHRRHCGARRVAPSATAATTHPRAELLEKLSGAPADAHKAGYAAFAPPIVDRYLNEHLFCDIFERDLLTWQERERPQLPSSPPWAKAPLPMLRSHSAICLRQGLTEGQLRQMTEIVNGLKEDAAPLLHAAC